MKNSNFKKERRRKKGRNDKTKLMIQIVIESSVRKMIFEFDWKNMCEVEKENQQIYHNNSLQDELTQVHAHSCEEEKGNQQIHLFFS